MCEDDLSQRTVVRQYEVREQISADECQVSLPRQVASGCMRKVRTRKTSIGKRNPDRMKGAIHPSAGRTRLDDSDGRQIELRGDVLVDRGHRGSGVDQRQSGKRRRGAPPLTVE